MADKNVVEEAIELVDTMTDAELNKFVDYIRFTMKDRANRRNAKARAQIGIGDRVKLAGTYKPAYLTGHTGEVVEMKQTRVLVKLDCGPIGKFKSGKVLTTPGSLEVLEKAKV